MKTYIVKHYNPNYSDRGEIEVKAKNEKEAYKKFNESRPYEIPYKATEKII